MTNTRQTTDAEESEETAGDGGRFMTPPVDEILEENPTPDEL